MVVTRPKYQIVNPDIEKKTQLQYGIRGITFALNFKRFFRWFLNLSTNMDM